MRCSLRWMAVLVTAISLSACSNELIVLLPEAGGKVGQLDITGNGSSVTLDSANTGARAGPLGVDSVSLAETQIRADFASALSAMPPPPVSYILYFAEGTTSVVESSRDAMTRMLADARSRKAAEIQVTGHTDRVGSVQDNDTLARQRAAMVRSVLVRQGLDAASVRAVGRGERAPLIATDDGVEEARNRRVEIIVR